MDLSSTHTSTVQNQPTAPRSSHWTVGMMYYCRLLHAMRKWSCFMHSVMTETTEKLLMYVIINPHHQQTWLPQLLRLHWEYFLSPEQFYIPALCKRIKRNLKPDKDLPCVSFCLERRVWVLPKKMATSVTCLFETKREAAPFPLIFHTETLKIVLSWLWVVSHQNLGCDFITA